MTTTKPPAAQAGSYRVGDLDLNRIAALQQQGLIRHLGVSTVSLADAIAELDAI